MSLALAGIVSAHDREAALRQIAPQKGSQRFVVIPMRSLTEYGADGRRLVGR
jgi:hypothetical protein